MVSRRNDIPNILDQNHFQPLMLTQWKRGFCGEKDTESRCRKSIIIVDIQVTLPGMPFETNSVNNEQNGYALF